MSNETDIPNPDPERLWRHRRWMAWIGLAFSFVSWLVGIVASINDPSTASSAIHPLSESGMWVGLVPMASYVGNCMVDTAMSPLK